MPSPLQQRILEDVKTAMRAHQREQVAALRLVTAALKQREVDTREALDDAAVLAVLDKMVKQRRESLAVYLEAGRDDLAAGEQFELDLISAYLPEPLGAEQLATLIERAIEDSAATSMRDMGKVMGLLRPAVQGRADMSAVSAAVRARLA